jgi:diphthamide synthase (EF-2-diphthine--ammonia ligase)
LERGKDSAIALYDILNNMYVDVAVLMTTYTEEYNRVSMHGVSLELVKKQAASLGLDLLKIPLPADCSNEIYEDRMAVALQRLRSMGVLEVVFGDIFLEDVRRYREKNLESGFQRSIPALGL